MRRMTSAVLAVTAALLALLFTASVAGAQAPDATISVTGSETTWSPPNVTVTTGDTVRWSFDGATLNHNVHGTSANWAPPLQSPLGTDQDPVDYTFTAPGVYTFLCDVHGSAMSGTVTVEDPGADPLENVLVFSETAGFRHSSIDEGITAIQEIGAANDFDVDATEDSTAFNSANLAQYDAVVFLSTTGDVLTDEQQDAFEGYMQAGGGYVGIHAAADTEYTWPWYGEMLGGYFRNHPAGTPTATVHIEDTDEPSTERPARRLGADRRVVQLPIARQPGRQRRRHRLLGARQRGQGARHDGRVDLRRGRRQRRPTTTTRSRGARTSTAATSGTRAWATPRPRSAPGAGNIRSHILGGLQTVTGAEEADCGEPRQATPEPSDFEMVTIDDDTESPMELDRRRRRPRVLRRAHHRRAQRLQPGQRPGHHGDHDPGLVRAGERPDRHPAGAGLRRPRHLYVAYTPPRPNTNNVSTHLALHGRRRTTRSTRPPSSSSSPWTAQRPSAATPAGSLAFAPNGDLYISTGDNTNPFASDGFAPIDERPGREFWDAQRTSANSNNHNGKVLRIHPLPGATGAPGIGTTYSIPGGNMFAPGTPQTLPEIYAMGFRNPFRITVDPNTGWVLVGNYGPDAGATDPNRGPQGSVEFEVVKGPGFYGWPYCVRDNVPYNDYNFANSTSGPKFNCANLTNDSPNNTGIQTCRRPSRPRCGWATSETDSRVPGLGPGGAPTGGPRYQFDPDLDSPTKFPEYYDEHWFIGEWNNGWLAHRDAR